MATVHLARMDGPGGFQKWVAIKRIHPSLVEDETFVQMFIDEARVAARISHPNVAIVFELGKHEDTYWIAMEYLHGEPLREVMRRAEDLGQAVPPEIACRMIADAAEGLHAAHELVGKNGERMELVHRDVTPHNLFVTYDGTTKVVDFGIAKFATRMASTRAGTVKGKLAYMSPEQVAGEAVDRQTDLFALGVVLWELTTGKRLFRMENDLDTVAKVQECDVPRPSTVLKGYPLDLERIVMKALAKKKEERYTTAREFARALQGLLMRRGLFIASEEVAAYVRSIFQDRIRRREAHLRWAADVTQTLSGEEGAREKITEPLRTRPATAPPQVSGVLSGGAAEDSSDEADTLITAAPDDMGSVKSSRRDVDPATPEGLAFNKTQRVLVTGPRTPPPHAMPPAPWGAMGAAGVPVAPPPPSHGVGVGFPAPPPGPMRTPPARGPMPPPLPAPPAAPTPVSPQLPRIPPPMAPPRAPVAPSSFHPPPQAGLRTLPASMRFKGRSRLTVVLVALGLVAAALMGVGAALMFRAFTTSRGAQDLDLDPVSTMGPGESSPTEPVGGGAVETPPGTVPQPPATTKPEPSAIPSASAATRPAPIAPVTPREPTSFGSLTVVCLPACDDVQDNGVSLGGSPVVNRRTPSGARRVTLIWSTPTPARKTVTATVSPDKLTKVYENHPNNR
jgi:serine/threonine-protein kinase